MVRYYYYASITNVIVQVCNCSRWALGGDCYMAEPLKDIYDEPFLRQFSGKIKAVYDSFATEEFITAIMSHDWDELKLKERIRRIAETLGVYLPTQYEEALDTLYAIDETCTGFPYLFFPDFVEVYGRADEHWAISMKALERFTSKSSAEFAVRIFILTHPEKMMEQMLAWASHPDEHVRRLASEGSRPRLPWGQALPMFKQDPSPILPVLELLKEDSSLYVRKSVANNLNDIAKDHPEIVVETAKRWIGVNPHTDWIVRHGCRTLIRKADPDVLSLFGYAETGDQSPLAVSATLSVNPTTIAIGSSCELNYELHIRGGDAAKIRIEYGIYFVKSSGRTSRKLFLLSDKTVQGGSILTGSRNHHWANLTTRRHYPGDHVITLLVNGTEVAETVVHVVE
jgi:3-methyladenine DNA glycosylase AlkC